MNVIFFLLTHSDRKLSWDSFLLIVVRMWSIFLDIQRLSVRCGYCGYWSGFYHFCTGCTAQRRTAWPGAAQISLQPSGACLHVLPVSGWLPHTVQRHSPNCWLWVCDQNCPLAQGAPHLSPQLKLPTTLVRISDGWIFLNMYTFSRNQWTLLQTG